MAGIDKLCLCECRQRKKKKTKNFSYFASAREVMYKKTNRKNVELVFESQLSLDFKIVSHKNKLIDLLVTGLFFVSIQVPRFCKLFIDFFFVVFSFVCVSRDIFFFFNGPPII